jgi:hypothetical protein
MKVLEPKGEISLGQPSVFAKPEQLAGNYCNVAVIKHNKREFVFDFFSHVEEARILLSRIITSPQHAKAIHRVLAINIEKYEKTYQKIEED